uniref:Alpha-ketoglutarate-dependent dioxygenase alkB homolog 5 n=1 Tax=Plectus sambesii TaxID=2011161 RepID=A0A914XRH0_9BILA
MERRWAWKDRENIQVLTFLNDESPVENDVCLLDDDEDDDELLDGGVLYESEEDKIRAGIVQKRLFSDRLCEQLEEQIEMVEEKANRGEYKKNTVDRSPLRVKYFFGEGYTYGDQLERKGPGMERLYPKTGPDAVDPIPEWIKKLVIAPCFRAGLIPSMEWANSAVINDYLPGGCIVSHVDPIQLFDRPIVSINLLSDSALCFGCKFRFKPIRVSPPVLRLPMKRGAVTLLSNYAADGITHCVRPEDVIHRRQVIIIRRVFPDAPRLPPPAVEPWNDLTRTVRLTPIYKSAIDERRGGTASRVSKGANSGRTLTGQYRKRQHSGDSEVASAEESSPPTPLTRKKHPRIVF